MSKSYKGGDFEREICKRLSMWWTGGQRDDVFWRSSQSGGRATQRAKSGKATYGSYGDIAAVDPIGEPLLKLFTIELKRGSSYGCPADLLDASPTNAVRPFEAAINQAISSHYAAGSYGWMIIARRDHKIAMVYVGPAAIMRFARWRQILAPPVAKFSLLVNQPGGAKPTLTQFAALPLEMFLAMADPKEIMQMKL